MSVYLFLIGWIVIVGLFAYQTKRKEMQYLYLITSFMLLYLIMALRADNIGADTQNYLNLFTNISNGVVTVGTEVRYEKGFLLFLTALSNINVSPQFMLASVSFLILIPIFILIKKYSKIPWMSIMLFVTLTFFLNSMNITRQYIALGFTIVAVINLIENRNKSFFIFIFIAMLFHESAITVVAIWLLSKIKLTKITKRKIMVILLIAAVLPTILLQLMVIFLPSYSGYINSAETNQLGSVLFFCVYMAFFIFIYSIIGKEQNDYKKNVFLWLLLLGVIIQFYGIQLSIFSRIAEYFTIYYIVMVPNALIKSNKKILYLSLYSIMISTIFYMISILVLRPEWFKVTPYYFFWINS